MLYYAGIGARTTPKDVLILMFLLAQDLNKLGYKLRSGGANGADTAFEKGAGENKDIYVPYKNFNGRCNGILVDYPKMFDIVKRIRKEAVRYSDPTKKFYARNIAQMLGDLKQPKSDFAVCWTPNGEMVGGTGFAMEVAKCYGIKVFNYGAYDDPNDLRPELLNYILEKHGNE